MTAADRIALSDLNYTEAMRDLTRRAGGTVLDDGGVCLFASVHALPVLVNGVVRTDPHLAPADVLARARAFFAMRVRGFSVLVCGEADADLHAAASAAGLVEMGRSPGMVLDRRLADAVPPPGVTLRRVEDDADCAAFAGVVGAAYATYGMPSDVAPAVLAHRDVLVAPHILSFLATIEDGTPAAGAMTLLTHGVAGIYWVGTIPSARGRGLAELCTRAAGNAGFDAGGRIAVLQASVMGAPLYRRMGYAEVTRYPYLVQPTPPAA
jgi:ribosomal protein S18 acetylase RimI-like enzyme